MNAVVYYSNTGQSEAIAGYFAEQLEYPLADIEANPGNCFQNLVLVFPVHCQNIPDAVKAFLKRIAVENLTVIATYGKMCCGNVLYEIQKKYQKNIIAGAYVPTKHAYIRNDRPFFDFDGLAKILQKIQNPSPCPIPRRYKNPFAALFPKLRSRLGLQICRNGKCNGCNLCAARCSLGAITSGVTNRKCIRCLKCVAVCPRHALDVKIRLPLKLYLRKEKKNETIIYL